MDAAHIERVNRELKARTGVDFSRYRDPELTEAIGNAMTFPLYLGRSLARPVGLLLLLTLLAFVLTDNPYFRTLLAFPGSLLIIVNGVLLGVVLFIHRIGADMRTVFDISTDLSVQALKDIGSARERLASAGRFPGPLEIFQGVNAIVILPIVIQTLKRKIPFLGGLAGRLTEGFFNMADRRLGKRIQRAAPGTAVPVEPAEAAAWLSRAEQAVESAQAHIARAVNTVTRILAFPFTAVFAVVALITVGILYGGWVLTA